MNGQPRAPNGRFMNNRNDAAAEINEIWNNFLQTINFLLWIIRNSPFALIFYILFKYMNAVGILNEIVSKYICNCQNCTELNGGKKSSYL